MKAYLLLEKIHGEGYSVTMNDTGAVHVRPAAEGAAMPDALLDELRAHKPDIISTLQRVPACSLEEERRLTDAYCRSSREMRLSCHRRAMQVRDRMQVPFYAANILALREAFGGAP